VDEYLEKQAVSYLDKYLATQQDKRLYSDVTLSEDWFLETRLSTTNARTYPGIKYTLRGVNFGLFSRAKYLGVTISNRSAENQKCLPIPIIRSSLDSSPEAATPRGNQAFA